MKAVILAGGRGERLRPLTDNIPKPLASVLGKPFLEYLIRYLKNQGITDLVLATGYKTDLIEDYFKKGEDLGVKIIYSKENFPLGTAGPVKNAENLIRDEEVLVLNGDSFLDIDIKKMIEFHRAMAMPITIAVAKVENSMRYGQLIIENDLISQFKEKGQTIESNFINAGIYILNKEVLKQIPEGRKIDFEKEVFPRFSNKIAAFKTTGYFIDIGIEQDYNKFIQDIKKRGTRFLS